MRILSNLLKLILPLLAGIGVATLADKTLVGKAPMYDEPVSPGFNPRKLTWFLAAFIVGGMVLKFIARKTNLKILK